MIGAKQNDSDGLEKCKSKLEESCKINNYLQEKNEILEWERNVKAKQLDDYINNIRNLAKTLDKTEPFVDVELQKRLEIMKAENLRLHNIELAKKNQHDLEKKRNPNLHFPKSKIIQGGKILYGIVFNTTTYFFIIL